MSVRNLRQEFSGNLNWNRSELPNREDACGLGGEGAAPFPRSA